MSCPSIIIDEGSSALALTRAIFDRRNRTVKRKLLAAVVLLAVGVGAIGYVLYAPTTGALRRRDPLPHRHRHAPTT